jgi:hypothetical protein
VATAAGEHERAEALTQQITDLYWRGQALTRLATMLVEMSNEISAVAENACGGSPLMIRARHLIAAALVTVSWIQIVSSLAVVAPSVVSAVADEVLARWALDPADRARDERGR